MSWSTAFLKKRKSLVAKTLLFVAGISVTLQIIPAAYASNYTAKEGDTFYLLSQRYGASVSQLMKANPNVSANNIYGGLALTIPGLQTNSVNVTAAAAPAAKLVAAQTTAADISAVKVSGDANVVEAWGKSFNYSKTIDVKATAYSASASENGKWGAVDYFGNPLQLGTIAVDPGVIPMGTKVLVTGYSFSGLPKNAFVATASDQGGSIKGNRIDIFVPGAASKIADFGIQNVKLYVLN